jgi:hypothetical protein
MPVLTDQSYHLSAHWATTWPMVQIQWQVFSTTTLKVMGTGKSDTRSWSCVFRHLFQFIGAHFMNEWRQKSYDKRGRCSLAVTILKSTWLGATILSIVPATLRAISSPEPLDLLCFIVCFISHIYQYGEQPGNWFFSSCVDLFSVVQNPTISLLHARGGDIRSYLFTFLFGMYRLLNGIGIHGRFRKIQVRVGRVGLGFWT